MRILFAVILLMCSLSSYAKEGIVIQFNIDSETPSEGKIEKSSYTNGVLVGLNDFGEYRFDNFYKIRFITKSSDNKNVNLVFTLNQYFGEKLYYIGDKPLDIPIGETKQFELTSNKSHYKITISVAYGDSELIAK